MSVMTINLPDSFCARLKEAAATNNRTLEHFVVLAIIEKLSSFLTADYLEQRAKRAKLDRFEALLSKIPDEEPEEDDKVLRGSEQVHRALAAS